MRTIEQFAAARRTDQDDLEKALFPAVAEAIKIYPAQGWYNELLRDIEKAYTDVYHREGGKGTPTQVDDFVRDARDTLDKTDSPDDNTVDRISVWLATAILNAATTEAVGTDEEFVVMEWVTMHDGDVRGAHKAVEGQQRPPGEKFDVGGEKMRYPGDPTVSIELWINCRCALAPAEPDQFRLSELTAAGYDAAQEEPMTDDMMPTPWHGVLAPEGVWSGDGRSFAPNSLTHRDLPLPLTYQKMSGPGHDGSCTVAKIERIARVDGEMRGSGHFLSTVESDETIGMIAEFGKFGVSVDADDAEFEFDEETGKVEFTRARIASASIVGIPAFAEAWVSLGEAPPGFMPDDDAGDMNDVCDPESDDYDPNACEEQTKDAGIAAALVSMTMKFVSDKPWSDFTQADYSDQQWKAACIMHVCDGTEKSCHKLPIREPSGALNRNGVHAAASRFNQVQGPSEAKARAKAALRGAYKQLGEEPPDAIKAAGTTVPFLDIAPGETEDGPGWLTHPVDTDRLRDYWTKGEGAAKIAWGTPGDFNRCRVNLAEYIKPEYLNGYCANRHKDALGFWPGEHHAVQDVKFGEGDAMSLVASGGWCAPSEWFEDPKFERLTPITVTEEGRVFGHVSGWTTCHTAYKVCTTPPHSVTSYARFLTGYVQTDKGPVPTGPWTYNTGHADPMSMRRAMAHYDNTGTVGADVTIGEDEHGIWVAGMMRPGAPEEAAHIIRASAPSPDWRRDRKFDHLDPGGKAMELIAILSVNTQGYPVPRVGIQNGEQESLVAAGVVMPDSALPERPELAMDHLVTRVADEMSKRKQRIDALRQRVSQ